MNIIKADLQHPFTAVPNASIRDPRLKLETLGVLTKLLSYPTDWVVCITALQRECRVGRDKLQRIFRELEAAGYMARTKKRMPDGTWSWPCRVYAEPLHHAAISRDGTPGTGTATHGKAGDKQSNKDKASLSRKELIVTDEMLRWAAENTPLVNPQQETAKFLDHPIATSRRYSSQSDLEADWRNWMRRGQEYQAKSGRQNRPTPKKSSTRRAANDLNDTSWLWS